MPHTQFDSEPSAESKLARLQTVLTVGDSCPCIYNLRDLAINKSRRVRGKDETPNPAGVVDVLVLVSFSILSRAKTRAASLSVQRPLSLCFDTHGSLQR